MRGWEKVTVFLKNILELIYARFDLYHSYLFMQLIRKMKIGTMKKRLSFVTFWNSSC